MAISEAQFLKDHDVHPTAQRLAVMRAISASPHATADHIFEIAGSDLGVISRQSVYDALSLLVASGLVRRIQPSGSPALYEDRVNDNHHHIVCRLCGTVRDVDCSVGLRPCLDADDTLGFEIDEAEVAFWGRCPSCLASGRVASALDPSTDRRQAKRSSAVPQYHPDQNR